MYWLRYRSHWKGTVTDCWTSGGRHHQHGWVSRAQTTSSVDVSVVSIHQMAPSIVAYCNLLLIYRPQKDERLSLPGWLTYRRRFASSNPVTATVNGRRVNRFVWLVTLTQTKSRPFTSVANCSALFTMMPYDVRHTPPCRRSWRKSRSRSRFDCEWNSKTLIPGALFTASLTQLNDQSKDWILIHGVPSFSTFPRPKIMQIHLFTTWLTQLSTQSKIGILTQRVSPLFQLFHDQKLCRSINYWHWISESCAACWTLLPVIHGW